MFENGQHSSSRRGQEGPWLSMVDGGAGDGEGLEATVPSEPGAGQETDIGECGKNHTG